MRERKRLRRWILPLLAGAVLALLLHFPLGEGLRPPSLAWLAGDRLESLLGDRIEELSELAWVPWLDRGRVEVSEPPMETPAEAPLKEAPPGMTLEDPIAALALVTERLEELRRSPRRRVALAQPVAISGSRAPEPLGELEPAPSVDGHGEPLSEDLAPERVAPSSEPRGPGRPLQGRARRPRADVTISDELREAAPSSGLLARAPQGSEPAGRASTTPIPPPPSARGRPAGEPAEETVDEPEPLIGPERAPELLPERLFQTGAAVERAGILRITPTIDYSFTDRASIVFNGIDILHAIFIGEVDTAQIRTETLRYSLGFRYGLPGGLNLRWTLPWLWRNVEVFPAGASGTDPGRERTESRFADSNFGLSYRLYQSDSRLPSITANATYSPESGGGASGSSFDRVSWGLSFLSESDPASLFLTLTHVHNFSESGPLRRGDTLGASVGYSYALNYDLVLSTSFGYATQIEDTTLDGRELARRAIASTLGLGISYALTRRTSLSVNLGIGLTDESPELTLSVSLPMAFDTRGWW